jgi:hypothetical protein
MHFVKVWIPVYPTASAAFRADVFTPIHRPLDVADGVGNHTVPITTVARRAFEE